MVSYLKTLLTSLLGEKTPSSSIGADYVVLLHGLACTSHFLYWIEKDLKKAGFHTIAIDYPSRKYRIEALAEQVIAPALKHYREKSTGKIHFIGHSMGCLLIRYYLQLYPLQQLGEVIMLTPPNHGSEVVNRWKKYWLFRAYFGPACQQLGTDEASLPLQLADPCYHPIIIAGSKDVPFLHYCFQIPLPHDGLVSVESTRLVGMKLHIVLPINHWQVLVNKTVRYHIRQCLTARQLDESQKYPACHTAVTSNNKGE